MKQFSDIILTQNDGVPHLKRLAPSTVPENLEAFKKEVYGRMPERHLLDLLKYVQ